MLGEEGFYLNSPLRKPLLSEETESAQRCGGFCKSKYEAEVGGDATGKGSGHLTLPSQGHSDLDFAFPSSLDFIDAGIVELKPSPPLPQSVSFEPSLLSFLIYSILRQDGKTVAAKMFHVY
ncbi:unnamed protein product [Linum trigynum]|uniref:Uncharacterized protein n=1 Tax=Linum trigynum TaxID=586398 RepID=A0AAV2DB07_9ROSI